jgi:NAD(P)-dependent dehydrogenase (short-subunit alcohol dehydrogenase family)
VDDRSSAERPNLTGRVCLVTGASSGIGLETAAALASMGASVVLHARDRHRGEAAAAEVRRRSPAADVSLALADLASLADVRRLAADIRIRHERLHVLVNNAGAYNTTRSTTRDGFETTFGVNHLAHFLLTQELLPLLRASAPARIINVSSSAHRIGRLDLDDPNATRRYGGMRAYGTSKLANILFTYELARRLDGTGITANAVHPGSVATGFALNNGPLVRGAFHVFHIVGRPFFLTPARGADTVIYLASSADVEGITGKYWVKRRAVRSSAASYDEEAARRLWEVSERLVEQAIGAAPPR